MPQPLSSVLKNPKHLEIGCLGRPVLSQRPQLAVMAMEAIAAWAHVENFMMLTYIELAGGAGADAAAAYMALDGTGPKMAVVRQLASRKLSVENQALLQAILALVKSAQR